MSASLPFARVDVFADRAFAGNPAAAVLDADGLSDAAMAAIAREMRTAGTAFVAAPTADAADFRLRAFSPTREIPYSGHTTLGAARALLDAGRVAGERVVFETARGALPVQIERRARGPVLWLEPPLPACAAFDRPLAPVLSALGLSERSLGRWAPPAITPDTDLLLPVEGLAALRGLAPDFTGLAAVGNALGLRGVCVVSLETVEPMSAVHSRFFAPQFGIPEDVVTGSVHSPIAVWLHEHGQLVNRDGVARFTAEQGDALHRPGRLLVELEVSGGRPRRVRVGGRSVVVLSGTLRAP